MVRNKIPYILYTCVHKASRFRLALLQKRNQMKVLFLSSQGEVHRSDLYDVLAACGVEICRMSMTEAIRDDLSAYDAYCVLGDYRPLDVRIRCRLEQESAGKHVFLEAVGSFMGIYSDEPADTTRSRLVYLESEHNAVAGLTTGDLLDDEANRMMQPWIMTADCTPILVYREQIIAHSHTDAPVSEILEGSKSGLWMIGENVMMTSFVLHNFAKARFAPRGAWEKLICHIARWLTGVEPVSLPAPAVSYGCGAELTEDTAFEACRRAAVERGMNWLKEYLVEDGCGGILEGLHHNISPEGCQKIAKMIRTDCCGEAAGAFKLYGEIFGDPASREIGGNLDRLIYGPMQVHGGLYDGMLRWTETAWQVCYQDDAARAVLPTLYDCLFLGRDEFFPSVRRTLDFLVDTTARDGCRVSRTDMPLYDREGLRALRNEAHGYDSAHYNAYYHAALLLAYKFCGEEKYLDTARRGLETLMELYPDTVREHSETQEQCRLVFPLAALLEATGEEKHREMLYRVVRDLEEHKHPSGGYYEWDTGYKAIRSRESTDECSLLTENGDPVADLLYSVNWLPMGFAYAYYVTGDAWFRSLWRDIVRFFIGSQTCSDDVKTDGSWCRGFDMDLGEAYGCPHDIGWAAYASESGWTNAEILMGMMMPDILK